MFFDIPTYRGFVTGVLNYWTSSEPPPVGVTDVTLMPLRGGAGNQNPFNVPGLLFWYRADAGLTLSSNDTVTEWRDFSGNRFHAVQTGQSNSRPTFTSSDPDFNNRPCLNFNGTSQEITCSYDSRLSPRELTVFVIGKMNSGWGLYDTFIAIADNNNWSQGWAIGSRSSGTGLAFWFNSWNNFFEISNVLPKKILAVGRAGGPNGNLLLKVNRVTQGTTSSGSYLPANSPAPLRIGSAPGGYYGNCKIAEIIGYDRALSDAELRDIEDYLELKYNIVVPSLP